MICNFNDHTCPYHACMGDGCQKHIVLVQGVDLGPCNCTSQLHLKNHHRAIERIHRKNDTVIRSTSADLTFSTGTDPIRCHTSARLTAPMMDDLERSGIVTVLSANFDKGFIILSKKPFYDHEKLTNVFTFLFEKYKL